MAGPIPTICKHIKVPPGPPLGTPPYPGFRTRVHQLMNACEVDESEAQHGDEEHERQVLNCGFLHIFIGNLFI